MGYYRNCALTEETVKDDPTLGEFKKDAWKKAEHRGQREEFILDKAQQFLNAKKKLEKQQTNTQQDDTLRLYETEDKNVLRR